VSLEPGIRSGFNSIEPAAPDQGFRHPIALLHRYHLRSQPEAVRIETTRIIVKLLGDRCERR
jgi:hypothetical protein